MGLESLSPPGLVVNHLKGDPAECPQTLATDVVEISPPLDINNMTGNLGAMLALNFFMGVAARQS